MRRPPPAMRLPLAAIVLASAALAVGCAAPQRTDAGDPKPVTDVTPLEAQFAAHPDDPKLNLELGDRAAAGGDWLRAQQYYERAEALGTPETQIVPRVLRVLVMAHRYDEALDRCHRRLRQKPDDRGTRLVEAAIFEALERPRDAERELDLLVKTRPSDPNPYLALGKLYRDSYHDVPRARAMFQKYLALAPKGEEAESIRYQLDEEPTLDMPPDPTATSTMPTTPPTATTTPPPPTTPSTTGTPTGTPGASVPGTPPSNPTLAPEGAP